MRFLRRVRARRAGRPAPSASSLSNVHSDYDRRAEIKVRAL
ncbi:hypothetical protein [Streptomyces sp. WM6378]|nr:hypothetical protein [Streptomyces sp. WM6378]